MAGQVYVGLSEEASLWYAGLSLGQRRIVDRRLRGLAVDPERAPVRALSPSGRTIYVALATTDEGDVWAYRIDFVVDDLMRLRGRLPAIAVLRGKTLRR
jgi:hypothetical protein